MTGLSGIEACKRLKDREETCRIPVIMMTGFLYEKEAAVEAGADDFVSKPPDFTELAFRLKSIGRKKYLQVRTRDGGGESRRGRGGTRATGTRGLADHPC